MNSLHAIVAILALMGGVCMAAEDSVCAGDVKEIATDFRFTEGPIWHPDGYIIFSDIPANTIYALKDGEKEVYRRPSGGSNGLTFDAHGRLVACEHGNRRVSLTRENGEVDTLAGEYKGKRLNSPNDLVVRSDGSVYFTDPPYGVQAEKRELDFQGVYRITPDGKLQLLVKDFIKPNGLAFSPDEKVLYIADTEKSWVRAFDVQDDGSLTDGRVFARAPEGQQMRPDGMKVDVEGNLYVTGVGGVWVYSPEGVRTEVIETEQRPANCAFGGEDGKTFYITARSSVYTVRLKNPGATLDYRIKKAKEK